MHLDQFFAGLSNQSQQPVIDITMVSDTELDAIDSELIEDPSPLIPISVCKSGLKTAKRLQPDQTKTGKDQTSSLVFWFLRIKDHKKTGLCGLDRSEPVNLYSWPSPTKWAQDHSKQSRFDWEIN